MATIFVPFDSTGTGGCRSHPQGDSQTIGSDSCTGHRYRLEVSFSLNAISKHLMVLDRAGLIQRDVHGRDHICRLDCQPLRQAVAWIEGIRAFWETRLDALERHVLDRRKSK